MQVCCQYLPLLVPSVESERITSLVVAMVLFKRSKTSTARMLINQLDTQIQNVKVFFPSYLKSRIQSENKKTLNFESQDKLHLVWLSLLFAMDRIESLEYGEPNSSGRTVFIGLIPSPPSIDTRLEKKEEKISGKRRRFQWRGREWKK